MRNILLIIALTLISLDSYAQFSGFGIGAGGSVANFDYENQPNYSTNTQNFEGNSKLGGTGGIKLDFELGNENLKFTPEVFVIQNGSKEYFQNFRDLQTALLRRVNLDYIGLLVPFELYLPIENGLGVTDYYYNGFVLSARGYADYAFNGVVNNELQSQIFGQTLVQSQTPIYFKNRGDKFDFGVSIDGGFVIQGFAIKFGYNWGLKNIEFYEGSTSNGGNDTYLINNRGFTLTLGYQFKVRDNY